MGRPPSIPVAYDKRPQDPILISQGSSEGVLARMTSAEPGTTSLAELAHICSSGRRFPVTGETDQTPGGTRADVSLCFLPRASTCPLSRHSSLGMTGQRSSHAFHFLHLVYTLGPESSVLFEKGDK